MSALTFRRLADDPDRERLIPVAVPWVHDAWNPYADWFFGGAEQASGVIARWMARPGSEISIHRVTMAFEDEEQAVGGFVALGGKDLERCIRSDTLAALKEAGRDRSAFLERASAVSDLHRAAVGTDEFFLSKIGVLAPFRGAGRGRALVREYLSTGRAAGFQRYRLDVSSDNLPALRLYESLGFRTTAESASEKSGIRLVTMVLEIGADGDG